jgi:hypothetical protein
MQREEDFNQIKTELVSEIRGMREDFNRMLKMVETHDQSLYGDKLTVPGAMEDLRVLKTAELTRQKHMFAIWSAVFIGIAERVFHYLTGR